MVTSLLTQLAFSGRYFRTHSSSDHVSSDPESEHNGSSVKVLRGKSRIELQLVDRSREMVLGFASLTGYTSIYTLIIPYRAANYKRLRFPRKSSTSSARPFG